MSYFPANFLREITATIWEVPYPVPHLLLSDFREKKADGPGIQRPYTSGFCHTESAIGYENWGIHHRSGSVRAEIGICLPVFYTDLLRGGTPKNYLWKKRFCFLTRLRHKARRKQIFPAGVGTITIPIVKAAHAAVEFTSCAKLDCNYRWKTSVKPVSFLVTIVEAGGCTVMLPQRNRTLFWYSHSAS